ncbi:MULTISPECIES: hypothetical protein [Paenibacillus]|uniref:Uncharacterized protein n=1 Tax=Paenibacillus odorifer TaxID=189426 RepID=A0AB36J673_9BACL|nr:hypothetical protein [Paenibacillus odorifer]OMD10597.1 hypothetical protein BJP50_28180 [Paenibacillus odorifer]OME07454.1 hypothetical protein BSK60_31530 [Paenibacillus odorifer]OME10257.1 hypothetical protein BSK47_31030 [Paenibacillus odorifer]
MEIIQQVIEMRTAKIFDGILENEGGYRYKEFMDSIQSLTSVPSEIILNLEDIFLSHTREVIDICYELGLKEGVQLSKNRKGLEIDLFKTNNKSGSERKNLA